MSQLIAPEAQEILAEARYAQVATISPRAAPNVAPFWFYFDGERLILFTGENKTVANLRENGRVSVIVDVGDRFDEIKGVQISGAATVHPYDDAPKAVLRAVEQLQQKYADDLASDLYREFQGDGPPATVYVEVTPKIVRWWDFGNRIT